MLVPAFAGCANDATEADPTPGTPGVTASTPAATTSTPAAASPTVTPTPTSTPAAAKTESFDASASLPAGWTPVMGDWSVVAEASAPSAGNALKQSNASLNETMILADAFGSFSDLEASVSFRVLGGESGQAGGIMFRYVDAKNYYVARYNHLENSWNLFRTIEGKREKFQPVETEFSANLTDWIPMRVVAEGPHIQVFTGQKLVIDYNETAANAPASGKVGLWGRYDSVVLFDDLKAQTL